MSAHVGTLIGHYELVRKLGSGSAGEVYCAQDQKLSRTVAIKVLAEQVGIGSEVRWRFVQEAKAASALNHPNILTVYEAGQFQGSEYMVMEYVEGETLRDFLKAGRLELRDMLNISSQIAAALAAAHAANIIHRDIKPDNIMIRKDGIVKLLDFGLAKIKDQQSQLLSQTKPGTLLGTVGYMSPEQAQGEPADARSDIFSLGALFYEMACGFTPFLREEPIDTLYAILKSDPPPFQEEFGLPQQLQELIIKSLAKEPDDRYQAVQDILIDLRRLSKRLELELVIERTGLNTGKEPLQRGITSQLVLPGEAKNINVDLLLDDASKSSLARSSQLSQPSPSSSTMKPTSSADALKASSSPQSRGQAAQAEQAEKKVPLPSPSMAMLTEPAPQQISYLPWVLVAVLSIIVIIQAIIILRR